MASRPANQPDWAGLGNVAFLAKALSDANRLRILASVCEGEKSVTQIAETLGLSQPLVSHHLRELRRALLVTVTRRGPFVFYGPGSPSVAALVDNMDDLARELLAARTGFDG